MIFIKNLIYPQLVLYSSHMAYSTKKQDKLRADAERVLNMFKIAAVKLVGIYLPENSPYEMVVLHNMKGETAMWLPSTGLLRVATGRKGGLESVITKSDDFYIVVDEFLKRFPH